MKNVDNAKLLEVRELFLNNTQVLQSQVARTGPDRTALGQNLVENTMFKGARRQERLTDP